MSHSPLKILLTLFAVVALLVFADRYFFDRKLTHVGPVLVKKPASYVFSKLENARFFLLGLADIRNLVSENDKLKRENLVLTSRLASREEAEEENNFLRNALKIAPRFGGEIIYADIFSSQFNFSGYDILLNKGIEGGVKDNDIVITEEGVLIGKIKKSYSGFAQVLIVNDPEFSVTAKVLGSDTAGIAKGALDKGLYFDLIVQGDSIKEGDIIVSNGMDFFPPALVIGIVSYVKTSETDIFKQVKIKPAIGEVRMGRVLVISNF
ncbi:MAG: rod shape-determining protein MreC [Candidatus Staskawiczbacteria bacterium RIFCSPLOWO2_01_FULL_40_39]|nr:MAG: rod shape-determining protein MreC [Candidatus Yanofskybacteria bacterium RIFCSPHIGHO2_01_FULL_42_12]OGZ73777.1 MAG: rod shape-determining protein MreC [Candidatus Staskawiczbacteria bacterium RIFCSPLOWO2_01_FULL_40_39]OGZ73778.1 MAG: rod shape-determining protein MreC [Candidatus Staskawiczbacteria bacterium RIFCSPLOWO2_01_FULL_40_39]